ncbi:MAG: phosphotransferase family protein [Halioglobus sp.]|nr:phosphotransferase family protein [Halioglobus sp.]
MSEPDFDLHRFGEWLQTATGRGADFAVAPLRGGGSCDMFVLTQGDERFVIRRAPLVAVSDTAHNVIREYQVIEALTGSSVRVPSLLACCDDAQVLGAPFYIMRFVEGEVIRRSLPAQYCASPGAQPAIGEELVDALVELHAFEWRDTAIEQLARPEQFLERQVARWMSQLAGYRSRDLPGVDDVARWLDDNRPAQGELTVMHGDYKIDNALYSTELPPRILTLVDFEMTTVGDPLIDLAWAMIFWPEEGNLIAIAPPGTEGGMHAQYCQSPAALVARYAERTGRSLAAFQWYQAFAAWKLGIVLEASYARFLSGESKNPNHEFFGFLVDQLMQRASRFAFAQAPS